MRSSDNFKIDLWRNKLSEIFKLVTKFRARVLSSRLTNRIVKPNIDWNIVRNQNRGRKQWGGTWFENLKLYCVKRYIVTHSREMLNGFLILKIEIPFARYGPNEIS